MEQKTHQKPSKTSTTSSCFVSLKRTQPSPGGISRSGAATGRIASGALGPQFGVRPIH